MKDILLEPIAIEFQYSLVGPRKDCYHLLDPGTANVREFHGSKFPQHKNKMSKQPAIIRIVNALHIY